MSIDEEYELLRQLELFENLDPIQLKRLIFVSQRYQLQQGEYLFRQGDTVDGVFGIVKGSFSVILETPQGEVIAAHQHPGDLVGEMAAISGEPRSASVRADTEAEVIGIEKDLFLSTVINDPATALKMLQLMSLRLENQNKTLVNISGAQFLD